MKTNKVLKKNWMKPLIYIEHSRVNLQEEEAINTEVEKRRITGEHKTKGLSGMNYIERKSENLGVLLVDFSPVI